MKRLLSIIISVLFGVYAYSATDTLRLENGRQLFVDDYLISSTTLKRTFHYPTYYSLNPVLKADHDWEYNVVGDPYAAPFSGGVWYDDSVGLFKMWYSAGGRKRLGMITCYAESHDGKHWYKPLLDVVPHTNIVDTLEHDCVSVLLDKDEANPQRRYKMFVVAFNTSSSVSVHLKYSADGIHWSKTMATSGEVYDRTAAYYDPFRKQYVLSLKTLDEYHRRARNYLSGTDPELLVSLAHRTFDRSSDKFIRFWFTADEDDPRNKDYPQIHPQIYNHEAIRYESLMLGLFTIWQGPGNKECDSLGIQKKNEVLIGWSRDGFCWNRRDKTPFLPVGKSGSWNEGNVQSTCGNPIVVGDSLYFYVSGRYNNPKWDSNFSTGLAILRRDGFASMNGTGVLETKYFICKGGDLYINADIRDCLKIELIDKNNQIKKKISLRKFNNTHLKVASLLEYKGQVMQLRMSIKNGDIYSFEE